MDKYESKLRIEEIEKLKKKRQYKEAARLADTIEWHRIKNAVTLYKVADLYKICRNYSKCRELLEIAYERSPYAKNVVFALCDICLEFGDFEAATEHYKEYVALAPNDTGVWILKYKMLKALEAGIDERIEILETLKRKDRIEEWEFELATLYHRAGMAEKCVEECDEIILWFGEGSYVYKAMELKMLHEPLTPEQEAIYNRRGERKAQKEAELRARREARNTGRMPKSARRNAESSQAGSDTKVMPAISQSQAPAAPANAPEEEEEFHVKTINMGQFNTIDLQAELAANVSGYIGGEPSMVDRVTKESGPLPVPVESAEQSSESAADYSFASATNYSAEIPEESGASEEVFFEDATEDLRFAVRMPETRKTENIKLQEFKERYSREMEGKELPEGLGRLYGEEGEEVSFDTSGIPGSILEERVLNDGTVELTKHFEEAVEPEVVKVGKERRTQSRSRSEGKAHPEREQRVARREENYDPDYVNMLPSSEEKQISGQLNIGDILAGWEQMKRQQEESFKEELRKRTLANTGNMFADFEKEANSGLLATLENPALINSVTEQSSKEDFIKGVSVEDLKKGKTATRTTNVGQAPSELHVGRVIEAPLEPEEEKYEEEPEVFVQEEEAFEGNDAEDIATEETAIETVTEEAAEETAAEDVAEESEEPAPETEAEEDSDEENVFDEEVEEITAEEETTDVVEERDLEEELTDTSIIIEVAKEEDADEKMIQEILEEDAKSSKPAPAVKEEKPAEKAASAKEEKKEPESLYYGNVTSNISGNIWDEVDNVVPVASVSEGIVETEEGATKVMPDTAAIGAAVAAAAKAADKIAEEAASSEEEEEQGTEEKGGDLNKDAKKFFSPFLYSKKMKQQIMEAVDNISLAAYTGNLIITADSGESSAKLATIFYQYIKASDSNFTGKAAKIGAEKLNKKDMGEIFEKLANGALIVSHAGKMTNSTINAILQNLNQDARGVEVILHDTKAEIRRLLERAPILERFFNCRVDIIAVSAEMLAEYGRKYAEELGYSIDNLAMLAFSGRISELQIGTHMVSVDEVKEIVTNAIEHADQPSLDKAFRTMSGKRYDDEHRVILREKDFEFRKK